jgi:hypothetical protein
MIWVRSERDATGFLRFPTPKKSASSIGVGTLEGANNLSPLAIWEGLKNTEMEAHRENYHLLLAIAGTSHSSRVLIEFHLASAELLIPYPQCQGLRLLLSLSDLLNCRTSLRASSMTQMISPTMCRFGHRMQQLASQRSSKR